MSIRDSENNNGQQQQTAQTAAPAPQMQQTQQGPKVQTQTLQGGAGNLNSIFQRSGRTDGGDARASEALAVFNKLKEEAIAQQDLHDDFLVFRFDRDQNRVGYSALLVVKRAAINGQQVIVTRPLVMPNDQITLPTKKLTIQNGMHQETIEAEADVQDVFTTQYWNRICDSIRQQTGKHDAMVINAGPTVIPADFDLKDELVLKQLLIKSVNLCDDMLAKRSGEQPFSVAMLKGTDETLAARLNFTGKPMHDSLGYPIRSDILVSLNRVKKPGQQENEFYEAEDKLNQVSCFVNLEYTPQPQQAIYGAPQQTQQLPPLTPAIVITDVRQAEWLKANTMELYLFALSNAFRVTANQSWARSLLPQLGKVKDMRDIGAIGYLSRLAARVETKTETFTDQNFAELLYNMVRPSPVFMSDLNRFGDNAAIENVFIDALGGVNQQRAVAAIIAGVNNLIGGGFEKFFDHNTMPIIQPYGTDIQLGYYLDGEGEKQDRRDLDVLGALNASDGNIQEWMSWYGTQCNVAVHPELRARQSKNFDRQYLGNSVTYTTRAHRGIWNPKFIEALDKAIASVGLTVAMDNVAQVFGAQRFSGNLAIADYAVTGTAQVSSGLVSNGGYNPQFGVGQGSGFY